MGAVVLVIALALRALQASPHLSANADAVALLDRLDLGADLDGLADDLVAYADGQGRTAPAAVDGVDVAAADAAAFDLDVDIVVAEDFGLELGAVSLLVGLPRTINITSCFLTAAC